MSATLHKIADKITGKHHVDHATTSTANTTTGLTNPGLNSSARNDAALAAGAPAGNQLGGVGPNYAGTNYTAANNGALKEGAQVRDTGLHSIGKHTTSTTTTTHKDHHLGRDAALGSGLATGLHSSSHSSLGSSTASSLTSSSSSSLGATNTEMTRDDAMTRSEEHLLVGKERVNVGKAGLHKFVTTEKVSTAVPIIRERAVVEREPITEANRHLAMSGPDFKEAHYEVNLMEERAVAEKEEVPIERVRLRKEVEQTQQYVEADLRKEHIEVIDGTKQLGTAATGTTGLAGSHHSKLGNEIRAEERHLENTSARRNL